MPIPWLWLWSQECIYIYQNPLKRTLKIKYVCCTEVIRTLKKKWWEPTSVLVVTSAVFYVSGSVSRNILSLGEHYNNLFLSWWNEILRCLFLFCLPHQASWLVNWVLWRKSNLMPSPSPVLNQTARRIRDTPAVSRTHFLLERLWYVSSIQNYLQGMPQDAPFRENKEGFVPLLSSILII